MKKMLILSFCLMAACATQPVDRQAYEQCLIVKSKPARNLRLFDSRDFHLAYARDPDVTNLEYVSLWMQDTEACWNVIKQVTNECIMESSSGLTDAEIERVTQQVLESYRAEMAQRVLKDRKYIQEEGVIKFLEDYALDEDSALFCR